MSIKHENIKYDTSLPFKIFTFKAKNLDRIIQPHWHQSTEILYCIDGNLKIKFPEKSYILEKSQFIVINPNQIHSTQSLSRNWVVCIELSLTLMNTLSKNTFMKDFIFDTSKCLSSSPHDTMIQDRFIKLIQHLESKEDSILKDIDLTCDIYQLIRNLFTNYSLSIDSEYTGSNTRFAKQVINYLDKHYYENLSLHTLAKFCSYSNSYTSRMIRKNLGTTFSDLLTSIRLSKATTLIRKETNNSNLNFFEIANETGFKNYRNFYNCFKQKYHMSPSEYKNTLYQEKSV